MTPERAYCQLPVNWTEDPSLNSMEPVRWYPGMDKELPDEGEHETFTRLPAGIVVSFGDKTPGEPFMVHPVASVAPPELASDTTHVASVELHDKFLKVTSAGS